MWRNIVRIEYDTLGLAWYCIIKISGSANQSKKLLPWPKFETLTGANNRSTYFNNSVKLLDASIFYKDSVSVSDVCELGAIEKIDSIQVPNF